MSKNSFLAADNDSYKLEGTVKLWHLYPTREDAEKWLSKNGGGWLWEVLPRADSDKDTILGESYRIPDKDGNDPQMPKEFPPLC